MSWKKRWMVFGLAGLLAVAGLGGSMTSAFAYGAGDQPLAQIELSGNCNNPDYPLCAPPPAGVGTGGIWFWIEIDADGTGDIAGAECFHTVGGVGGPGGAGAIPIRGEVSWTYSNLADGLAAGAEFFGTVDPSDQYYLVSVPDPFGGPPVMLLIPTTVGHYVFHPTNGVSLQLQVAP